MDLRPLTVCLALCVALFAVSHGCSTGKEFVTSFLPNFRSNNKAQTLNLVLTAQESEATVDIQVGSIAFSKKVKLSARETRWVSLPCGAELQKPCVNPDSAVRISSSATISVVSFNRRFATGDGAVVYPTDQLGTEYFVFTPPAGPFRMHKLMAIVNGNSNNQITITPPCNMRLSQGAWKQGKAVTITLAPYATYLVRSPKSLTGLRIQSQQPVAVLAGHQCLSLGGKCEHVYEQLPAVSQLGQEYMVPRTRNCKALNWAVIVAVEDNTIVTLNKGKRSQQHVLSKAGDVAFPKVMARQPMLIKSSKKVMVMYLSNNKPHDPFLLTLTPNSKLHTVWAVETVAGLENTVAIVSEREGAGSVQVCMNKEHCKKPKWRRVTADKRLVWANVVVGRQQAHVTVEGDARMAVYAYGGSRRHGYGLAGVCSEAATPPPPPADPCDTIRCQKTERCVEGKCIPVSTATCHVLGDPHYRTFDGRCYDFQGSCSYIMSTVKEATSGIEPFTVITHNNNRGSRYVSYVRTVTVTVYGQTITIGSNKGKVQVNGELQYLPVSLLGGKICITQSGCFASLQTDFGLNVKYDWNTRLYITVPSSYQHLLGGLCGNYNGDKSDDLPEPKGSSLPAVLEMIKDWKVKSSDLFCSDNCAGTCPQCSIELQNHYRRPALCGIISKPNGPFAACNSRVNPSLYLDNCVYDVCINNGAKRDLCDNLKNYADACIAEGVKVDPEWRTITKCPLPCPANSHYEASGTACPATCTSDSQSQCPEISAEGCQCDDGFVLSGDKCVPKTSCGCQYKGKYYPAGVTFWADDSCTSKCQCQNGKVQCTAVTCKENEQCEMKGGVRDCYPVSYSTCQATGDAHFKTFDNKSFDFQGTCTYIMSQRVKEADQSLEPFQVMLQNEYRGKNNAVSYTKSVSLIVFGNITVSMTRIRPDVMLLKGRPVNLPYSMDDGKLSLFRRGFFGIVKTSFGLTLKFNWDGHLSLTLPSQYASATGGLCGNYNGKPDDDFEKPDGQQAPNTVDFGNSWKIGGAPGCTSDCPNNKCPECVPVLITRYQERRYCGIISDKQGPFRQCHAKLDHIPFLTDCVYDLCVYQAHASALCKSLSAYSTACQEAGATVESWRTPSFCPPKCGENSHYEVRAPPCQLTCNGLMAPAGCSQDDPPIEGCVCDDGFMMSDDKCVPLAECGCLHKGEYYKNGEVFYPEDRCHVRCYCADGGQVECNQKNHCSATEECVVKDGLASCTPKGAGSCSVSGDREVRTFDGQAYPLHGDCQFTLAEVEEKEGGMEPFSVYIQQNTNKDGSITRNVEFSVYDLEFNLESGRVWEVKVDDVTLTLPMSLADGKVRVHQNGLHIIIETDFDLKLSYDTVAGVFLQLPSTYGGLTEGLCGNFNDEPSDDPANLPGRPTDIKPWIRSSCDTTCKGNSCNQGPKNPEAEKACGIITAPGGPFAGCHSTVTPIPDFDSCVKEMSTDKKGEDVLCRHIQNYVTACQLAGAEIKEWRSNSFCPMKCPTGSHYEVCAAGCSATCYSLEKSQPCPLCQEGCVCDAGLVSDGERCVAFENCGCVVDGLYYQSDTSVVMEDCSERCECSRGHFTCKDTQCNANEECANKDGEINCYRKDPCIETKCREKEHCVSSDGNAECVANSKAECWLLGDPHITTFDQWKYSFQGTCSYVLFKTTGADSTLPEITVTGKNELRGNADGSFVRTATVELLGHTIAITKGEKGIVQVDGIKSQLPVTLEGGSITISQSGMRGLLQTDFGFEVSFDWSSLLKLSLSSSYFGNVGGLCGNYNGIKEDELTTPTGSRGVNVTQWAESWSIEDNDPFCYHFCEGECPQCSAEDRKKYSGPKYCGILSDKTGPFSGCHSAVAVEDVVSDCLFDVCVNNGRQEVLCEALSNYMAECQAAGVKVLKWRQLSGCAVECPAHSQYKECGSACPETCSPQPQACPKICVEGCFCDPGYVLSGNECVTKEKGCGCNYEGRYYLPDTTFWSDSKCTEKCTCDSATQKVTCKKAGCRHGESCGVVDGVQDCYPVKFQTCTALGDPHFKTFDGKKYDFQGNCVYKLAALCGESTGLTPFQVNLENNNRGNIKVSYSKVVSVKLYGSTYTLSKDYAGKVLVDGVGNSLPYSNKTTQTEIRVYRRHRMAVLETNFLKVSFDFASAVRVDLATSYKDATCGLCGNFNGKPEDDLMLPSGTLTSNPNEFGVSQWVADVKGCSRDCTGCAEPLPENFVPPSYVSICDIITATDGPMADCVGRVDSQQYRADCVYDMVLSEGREQAACDIISDYVEECQRQGGKAKSWRSRQLCWMRCGANSSYSVSAPGCPPTCNSAAPSGECKTTPSEGCVCNPGFLQSEDKCVPLAGCGCTFNGQYIPSGKRFYADYNCERSCVCHGGMVTCKNKPCTEGKSCGVHKGVRGCYKAVGGQQQGHNQTG